MSDSLPCLRCEVVPTRAIGSRRQAGSALLFALIALVLLALAAAALTRSVNTGSLVVGNLGFKQDAALASDQAVEAAIVWLQSNGALLLANSPTAGYYATSLDALDPTGRQTSAASRAVVDWDLDSCAGVSGAYSSCITPSDEISINGNRARWVITRLCASAGNPNAVTNSCMSPLFVSGPDDQNRSGYDYSKPTSLGDVATAPLYRIIVRTVGPRGTASFTETIVHM